MKISPKSIYQITLVFFLLVIFVVSCSDNKETNFKVEGKLENLSTSQILAIKGITSDSIAIDTIDVAKDGEFTYQGMVESPVMISLFYGEGPINFVVEPNYNVKINGDIRNPDLIEIKGGAVNDDINKFMLDNRKTLITRSRILSKTENVDHAELKNVNLQLARSVKEYVEQNPTKIASVVLMNDFSINNTSVDLLGKNIARLKGAALDFYLTTDLKAYYDKVKISAVGAIAPPVTLTSTKGTTVSISDFKGKPLLLIFDLKDAPLNEKYFTAMKEAQKELKGKVSFLAIIIDDDPKNPDQKTVKIANDLDWPVLLDGKKWNSNEVKKYNIRTAPYMLLISPEGIIEQRDVSLDSLVVQFNRKKPEKKLDQMDTES